MKPIIGVIAAGAMGAAVAKRLTQAGCTVLTTLDGRSDGTRERASKAGMHDVSLNDIVDRSDWILSIVPPSEAFALAQKVASSLRSGVNATTTRSAERRRAYVDCNAINPDSVKKIASLFEGSVVEFVDAAIIGGPPREGYDPTIYGSARAVEDAELLDRFSGLSQYGLKIKVLSGDAAGIGNASALKMSYAGISKGITGLFTAMILAAHASSPAIASALLAELKSSQPMLAERLKRSIPDMIPKAYRWVGEMEEIAEFVGEGGGGDIYMGLASLYGRIDRSVSVGGGGDVGVLEQFVRE